MFVLTLKIGNKTICFQGILFSVTELNKPQKLIFKYKNVIENVK